MNEKPPETIHHSYRLNGAGGQGACVAVQSVLQEHGLCGYTEWASPEWSFVYLTHLQPLAIRNLLGDLNTRFEIALKNGSAHFS